jgi:hypothetical protein
MAMARRRRSRWLAPLVVAGLIALVAWLPGLTAGAAPSLPPITAAQLLDKVSGASLPALEGTVRWSTNLGLGDIGSLISEAGGRGNTSGFDPTSLLSGTHTIEVWEAGPERLRLALLGQLTETDLIRNGTNAWLWDSSDQHVTHWLGVGSSGSAQPTAPPALAPDRIGARLLGRLSPSTTVSVGGTSMVAGRSVYQLIVAPTPGSPAAAGSTVSRIVVSVDSATGLPLRIRVYADGQSGPAVDIGYTSISFHTPSASRFSAPGGTVVQTVDLANHGGQPTPAGSPDGSGTVGKAAPVNPGGEARLSGPGGAGPGSGGDRRLIGSGWTAVVVTSYGGLGRPLYRLEQLATPVTGTFGTGRLVSTSLLNALILPDGRVLAGFVTPATLESAATAQP